MRGGFVKKRIIILVCLFVPCLALTVHPQGSSSTSSSKSQSSSSKPPVENARKVNEVFSALGFLPQGGPRQSTANLDIRITGYTPEPEATQLRKTLLEQGPNALLKALQKVKSKGKVSFTGHIGFYDLKFIRSIQTPEGRRILAVTDRPIQFLEAYYSGRSMDYTFGMMQLDLENKNKDEPGKKPKEEGQGILIFAGKVKVLESNKVEIENFGIEPIRLMGVRRL
jgi:hypothetical protein